MASSIINSDDGVVSGTSGIKTTGGDDGVLVFQSKGTETARINTDKQIVAAAGTASLPALTTTGDVNTGIFFPAADTIAFAEGGAEAMRIDSTGDVSIGTSSPAKRLTGVVLTIAESGAVSSGLEINVSGASAGELFSNSSSTTLNEYRALPLVFRTDNAERMRITSAGEVLVGGTTSIVSASGNFSLQRTDARPNINLFRNDTSVVATDEFGRISFHGNDTTSNTPTQLAFIAAAASDTHAAGDNPTDLVFGTTPDGSATVAEKMRLTEAGYLRLASGTGGIQFGGDTAAANALDDYEEGTWTPALTYSTPGTLSVGYQNREAFYTKIGNFVYFSCFVQLNAFTKGTASGTLRISGLPFTAQNPGNNELPINWSVFDTPLPTSAGQFPTPVVDDNATYINLLYATNNGGNTTWPDADSNSQYKLSGCYTV